MPDLLLRVADAGGEEGEDGEEVVERPRAEALPHQLVHLRQRYLHRLLGSK